MRKPALSMLLLALLLAVGFNCQNTVSVKNINAQTPQEAKDNGLPRPTPQPEKEKDKELFEAVKKNDVERAKELLESGADPNATEQKYYRNEKGDLKKSDFFDTPLGIAIDNKNTKMAELLLERGANVDKKAVVLDENFREHRVFPTFPQAVSNQDVPMMKLLIKHRADLNRDDDFVPVIIEAKKKDVIDLLIENGFDINMQNRETGDTALIRAAATNNLEMLKSILRYKPNLNLKLKPVNAAFDYQELNALQVAEREGNRQIIKELKKADAKK